MHWIPIVCPTDVDNHCRKVDPNFMNFPIKYQQHNDYLKLNIQDSTCEKGNVQNLITVHLVFTIFFPASWGIKEERRWLEVGNVRNQEKTGNNVNNLTIFSIFSHFVIIQSRGWKQSWHAYNLNTSKSLKTYVFL